MNLERNIFLLTPPYPVEERLGKLGLFGGRLPSISLLYLATALRSMCDVNIINASCTIVDLMHVFLTHKGFPTAALDSIPGIVCKGGRWCVTTNDQSGRSQRPRLHSVPRSEPDPDLIPNVHVHVTRLSLLLHILCFVAVLENVSFFSAERVVNEIELLVNQ
jgi:hypothetical protein